MGKGMKLSFMARNFFFRVINMKAWLACMALALSFHLSALTVIGQDTSMTEAQNEFDRKFAEAVRLQYSADSLTRLAQGVRSCLLYTSPSPRDGLQGIAEEIENEATSKQDKADMAFMAAERNGKPVSYTH